MARNEFLNVSPSFCVPLSPLQRVWRRSLCSQHCKVPPVSGTRAAHHPAAGPVAQRGRWHGYTVGPHALCTFYWTAAEDRRIAGTYGQTHAHQPVRAHITLTSICSSSSAHNYTKACVGKRGRHWRWGAGVLKNYCLGGVNLAVCCLFFNWGFKWSPSLKKTKNIVISK